MASVAVSFAALPLFEFHAFLFPVSVAGVWGGLGLRQLAGWLNARSTHSRGFLAQHLNVLGILATLISIVGIVAMILAHFILNLIAFAWSIPFANIGIH